MEERSVEYAERRSLLDYHATLGTLTPDFVEAIVEGRSRED
jgi:hypothetical protein